MSAIGSMPFAEEVRAGLGKADLGECGAPWLTAVWSTRTKATSSKPATANHPRMDGVRSGRGGDGSNNLGPRRTELGCRLDGRSNPGVADVAEVPQSRPRQPGPRPRKRRFAQRRPVGTSIRVGSALAVSRARGANPVSCSTRRAVTRSASGRPARTPVRSFDQRRPAHRLRQSYPRRPGAGAAQASAASRNPRFPAVESRECGCRPETR